MQIILFLFMMVLNNVVLAASDATQQVSVNFTNIKTCDLLHILTEHSGKSVIISEKIGGKINVSLRKTSWHEVLDTVLQMHGLVKRETANVITIAPLGELDKKEQIATQPTVFNLHHTSADSISKILGPAGVLSSSGKASAEVRTNMLVVADTSDKIAALKNLLQQVDVPAKQVLIEARIVCADEKFARDLGLEFGMAQEKESGKSSNNILAVGSHHGKFNFALAKLNNGSLLDLELAALESEGRGRVISSPKLLTTDRQAAYIESGAEIPYQEKTKEGDTSTTFKKAVLSLKVTPEVVAADTVNLLLQLNQDKVSQLTVNGVPAIDTRKIQTQVLVHNGETIVLGGIYEWSKSNNIISVPVLGKIPVLGLLFRKQETKMERKELLMFVTPRIVE
ncbi:STN domain-containing protein [Gammaproteobacteria bacterium]